MNYNTEQIVNGIIRYADNEVMGKLPTSGKWVMGTAIALASGKAMNIVDTLKANAIVNMLGLVDENGNIDADTLINALKEASEKYGSVSFDVPLVGRMTFSSADVDRLKTYFD